MLKVAMFRIKAKCQAILLLLIPFYTLSAWGLESDSQQPIYIDSDTASYDEKSGVSIYSGKVIYKQGSLQVNSDVMTFYIKDGEVIKIVVTGKPVVFKQTPGAGKEDVNGRALIGEYYPPTAKLLFIKQAVVWQGGNKSSSDFIEYDTKNSVIKAGDSANGSKRVHTVFEPKAKK